MDSPLSSELTSVTRKLLDKWMEWFQKKKHSQKRFLSFVTLLCVLVLVGFLYSLETLAYSLIIVIMAVMFSELFPFILYVPLVFFFAVVWLVLTATAIWDLFFFYKDLHFRENRIVLWIHGINIPLFLLLLFFLLKR